MELATWARRNWDPAPRTCNASRGQNTILLLTFSCRAQKEYLYRNFEIWVPVTIASDAGITTTTTTTTIDAASINLLFEVSISLLVSKFVMVGMLLFLLLLLVCLFHSGN